MYVVLSNPKDVVRQESTTIKRFLLTCGQAVTSGDGKEKPNTVLDQIIKVTKPTGGLGIPGLYVPSDPGAPDEKSGKGQILISFGELFEKVSQIIHVFQMIAQCELNHPRDST